MTKGNSILPYLCFMVGTLGVIVYYAGFGAFSIIPFGLTVILAIIGLVFADPDKPKMSRISCIVAVLYASTPVLMPFVKEFRFRQLEKQRAIETAPIYEKLDARIEELKPEVEEFFSKYGFMPEYKGMELLPRIGANGQLIQPPPQAKDEIIVPTDPFSPEDAPLRWVAIREWGVFIVSVGQDGKIQMPLPGVLMDGPPAHPLTGFAMLGVNPREREYTEDRGPLGMGDIYYYHGKGDLDEAFSELDEAWAEIDKRSPYEPTEMKDPGAKDPDPQSIRDSIVAENLLEEERYIAALALASRAVNERHMYEANWEEMDFRAERTRAMALYHLGSFRESADAFLDYLISRPNDILGHYMAGAALYYGGNEYSAKVHLSAASQISTTGPLIHEAYKRLQEFGKPGGPQFPVPAIVSKNRSSQENQIQQEMGSRAPQQ